MIDQEETTRQFVNAGWEIFELDGIVYATEVAQIGKNQIRSAVRRMDRPVTSGHSHTIFTLKSDTPSNSRAFTACGKDYNILESDPWAVR